MVRVYKNGPGGPPGGPKSILGEKWAQRAPPRGQKSARVKEGRFSDGTFPIGKVTFLVFSQTHVKILKIVLIFFWKIMKKVNGKPYLRTRIAFRGVVFRQPNDVFEESSYPYAGKSGIREKKKTNRKLRFLHKCHFSYGNNIHFEMRAVTKKKRALMQIF